MEEIERRPRLTFTTQSLESPMWFRKSLLSISLAAILIGNLFGGAQTRAQNASEKVDVEAISRIKDEALRHSQVMETVGYLTDVIGPRLTGSPGLKKAQSFTLELMRKWELSNPH